MTIRGLLAAVVVPVFLVTCFVVWKYFDIEYYRSLNVIETHFAHEQITFIKKLVNSTSGRYVKIANDWGAWDDTYEFIKTKNTKYIASNLQQSTLDTTDSDIMFFLDTNKSLVYSLARKNMQKDAAEMASLVKNTKINQEEGTFFTKTSDGNIYFAAYFRITDSNMTQPSRGYFMVLLSSERFVKNAFLNSGFDLSRMISVSSIHTKTSLGNNYKLNGNYINISITIPMLDKNYALKMTFKTHRDIFIFVRQMIDKTVVAVMLIFIIASVLMTLIMYFSLLRRIGIITKEFSNLESSPDYCARIPVSGIYELKLLAKTANKSLDDIVGLNQQLLMMTNIDGLTGIHNRRFFDDTLLKEIRIAARTGSQLSLLMLDIDNFKRFNDNYGHIIGDECLKTVANVLADSLNRPTDFAARYGGEEFTVILPATDVSGAKHVAEKIRAAIAQAKIDNNSHGKLSVTVSIGAYTCVPDQATMPADIIAKADSAMYNAKKTKNTVCHFHDC